MHDNGEMESRYLVHLDEIAGLYEVLGRPKQDVAMEEEEKIFFKRTRSCDRNSGRSTKSPRRWRKWRLVQG